MADVETLSAAAPARRLNVANRLTQFAAANPGAIAVVCPWRRSQSKYRFQRLRSGAAYSVATFAEIDSDATRIARGLSTWGVPAGTRLALLVKPGVEFVALVFGLLRAGMVIVLVDPGMGRRNLIQCLSEAEPEGFVGIGSAQAVRILLRHKFRRARWNVTVGRRWFWGGKTLVEVRSGECGRGSEGSHSQSEMRKPQLANTQADDPAAIIFTSGSTGPAKGVLYTHRMFDAQVEEIQSTYGIEPGDIDLACFPLFGLFNAAMGVTTVLPEMDFSRPAAANPKKLLAAANDWQVTQAFASPAVWRVLSNHCQRTGDRIESLRQVFSCGAPVPASVLRATLSCVGAGAEMHTPYGATECLPVSTIEAGEVLAETAARTAQGAGVCVGRKLDSIEWRVIRITDEPIATIEDANELPAGEIGELVVRGPQVSPAYITRVECNRQAKIAELRAGSFPPPVGAEDGPARHESLLRTLTWHRTGDVGYLDEHCRFWYCGRKSQRVVTAAGPLYTECVEAIFNAQPGVRRSALVGVGPRDNRTPVLVVEREAAAGARGWQKELLAIAHSNPAMRGIREVLVYPSLPVDVRHNAKINRELLAAWASKRMGIGKLTRSVHCMRSHAERGNED